MPRKIGGRPACHSHQYFEECRLDSNKEHGIRGMACQKQFAKKTPASRKREHLSEVPGDRDGQTVGCVAKDEKTTYAGKQTVINLDSGIEDEERDKDEDPLEGIPKTPMKDKKNKNKAGRFKDTLLSGKSKCADALDTAIAKEFARHDLPFQLVNRPWFS
ncbi:hypothetical protein SARC_02553 [Sphaeroforma arctica JP610]|uniref:Uncharacterized protein n=1 Tax=Sphaeroforma arctica JP610 TaxID=667725 RepID=A0A0L0G891_9EUKA|nr:hypothetical protein SARC_02553 [Sphaeroforma arctica JP610]KNC85257.1 hypothetical protein SARC_02553 [Sphaeroforma arctica JP610]|eukprot:XP_014159159.1 hypothetical protein SARC_02553 [Sphaeroforma arctica JP610]